MHEQNDQEMVYNEEVEIVLLSISCVIIAIINTLCIYVICKSSKLRKKPPTILIGNLIGTHMIQGACVLPLYIVRISKVASDNVQPYICDMFRFTYMLTFYSATVSVFLLSLDRVLAVRLLTKYDTYVTNRNVLKATLLAWVYIVSLCLLPFFGKYMDRSNALKNSKCNYLQQREWTIFMLIGNAFIPYTFIVVGYVYVHKKLQKISKYFADLGGNNGSIPLDQKEQKRNEKRKRKFLFHNKITRLTFIVVLTYGLTWSPTIIYYLLQHICLSCFSPKFYGSETKRFLSFLMKYINFFDAIIAPVIYCYYHDEFRFEFKRILCGQKKQYPTIESNGIACNNNLYSNTYAET